MEGDLVRHEMLHAFLRQGGHPRADFLERCGGVVGCIGECLTDSSAPVIAASVPRASPDSIEVSIEVWPESPSMQVDGGYFTVTVLARNPADLKW